MCRLLRAFIVINLVCSTAWAVTNTTVTIGRGNSTAPAIDPSYNGIGTVNANWDQNNNYKRSLIPCDAVFREMVFVMDAVQAAGETWDFTLVVNSNDTSMTCQIDDSGSADKCTSTTNVVVNAGDEVWVKAVPSSGSARDTHLRWNFTIDAEYMIWFGAQGELDLSDNEYTAAQGYRGSGVSSANSASQLVSTPGDVRNLDFKVYTAPGASNSRELTVYKNGAATSLDVTIADANTRASDDTTTVTFASFFFAISFLLDVFMFRFLKTNCS